MVVYINAGGNSPDYPNGDALVVSTSNVEVARFTSIYHPSTSVRIGSDASGNTLNSSGGVLTFASGASNQQVTMATMQTKGSMSFLGLNTSNPQYTLDVSGDINFTGRLMVNSQLIANNLYTTTYNNAPAIGSDYSLAILGPAASLYVPNGNGLFGGKGTFGGDGQFGGSVTAAGTGAFTVVSTPSVQTNRVQTSQVQASFDQGATDASFVRAMVPPNVTGSVAYAINAAGGNVFTAAYNSTSQTATVMVNVASSNLTVTYTDQPNVAGTASTLVLSGVNRKSGGVGYMTVGSSALANTPTHVSGDGYIAAFNSNGTSYAWSARVQGGVPTSVAVSADGQYIAASGTCSSSMVITDAQGTSTGTLLGPGAFLATLSSTGGLVFAAKTSGVQGAQGAQDAKFDGTGVVWTGAFSNAMTATYSASTFVVTNSNLTYTSNLVPNTVYSPFTGSNLVISLTSNVWTSNAFTKIVATAPTLATVPLSYTWVGTTAYDVSVSPTYNFASTSNLQTTTFPLTINAAQPGFSNALVLRYDLSGNLVWCSQTGGLAQPQIAAGRAGILAAHANPSLQTIAVSNVGFWNFAGLVNAYATQQPVSPAQVSVLPASTAVAVRGTDGTMRFTYYAPTSITHSIVNDYDSTALCMSSSSNTVVKWSMHSGSNITSFAPLPSTTALLSVAVDLTTGSVAMLGSNVSTTASTSITPVYPNGDPFATGVLSSNAAYFAAYYPPYLMIPSSAQITQSNAVAPACQIVQAGVGPVSRLISVQDAPNNLIEGYVGTQTAPVFVVSSDGQLRIASNVACYSLSNQHVYAASSLGVPGQTTLNTVSATTVSVSSSTTTSNLFTQQLTCSKDFTLAGNFTGVYGGGVACTATALDVNCARMTASNTVNLGGSDGQTVVITPGNVTVTSNLTTTSFKTSNVYATSLLYAPTLSASDSITVTNKFALTSNSALYAVGNYNNTNAAFVGIGTTVQASSKQANNSPYLLAVTGGGAFDNVYTGTLTVGTNLINTYDPTLLILGGTQPSFVSDNYAFGGLIPTVSKSSFTLFAGAGAMISQIFCTNSVYTRACGIGQYNVGIGTTCSTSPNPTYALDVCGNTRIAGNLSVTGNNTCNITWNATNGRLGINTMTPNYTLEVAGDLGVTGDISAMYSDNRLKTRINHLDNALDKITRLTAFTYKNNDLAKSFGFADDRTRVGLSAQDVAAVLPEAVRLAPFDREMVNHAERSKSGENYITVQYEQIVPLLVVAVQELKALIDDMKRH